ncbi:hypothetical protein [Gordonia shandongensis]|uniref:hypothetical protein n=1 Tax=Gordonia shandongensis TaxID=376351 RepID=UPI0003F871C5|nr:hypothetical protein [Gordonia shandongensis]
MTAPLAAGVSGLFLAAAAVGAWWLHPAVTAALVAAAVVVLTAWQVYRRRAGIALMPATALTVFVGPLTFGALAVIAFNGWIYRISADSGTESGHLQMIVGLITGVIGMTGAYLYGRVRAHRAQLGDVVEARIGDEPTGVDEDGWFFPQAR